MDEQKKQEQIDKHRDELEKLRRAWTQADRLSAVKDWNDRNDNILINVLEEHCEAMRQQLLDINMWMTPDRAGDKIIEYNRGQAIMQFINEFSKKICNSEKQRVIVEQSIKPIMTKMEKMNQDAGEFSRITGNNQPESKG